MFSLIQKVIRYKMKRIQRKLRKIGTYEVCKISLSSFDKKRYILDHGTNSLAYFYERINLNEIKIFKSIIFIYFRLK